MFLRESGVFQRHHGHETHEINGQYIWSDKAFAEGLLVGLEPMIGFDPMRSFIIRRSVRV